MNTREITIKPALNGWIVKVGCQTVVHTDKATMLKDLSDYYSDPGAMEKHYLSRAVNKTMDGQPAEAPFALRAVDPIPEQAIIEQIPTVQAVRAFTQPSSPGTVTETIPEMRRQRIVEPAPPQ